eukprot:scaffold13379_cov23-Cyclotella_meneghiniana.AAC.2
MWARQGLTSSLDNINSLLIRASLCFSALPSTQILLLQNLAKPSLGETKDIPSSKPATQLFFGRSRVQQVQRLQCKNVPFISSMMNSMIRETHVTQPRHVFLGFSCLARCVKVDFSILEQP